MCCHLKNDAIKKIGEYTLAQNPPLFFIDSTNFCEAKLSQHFEKELNILETCVLVSEFFFNPSNLLTSTLFRLFVYEFS